jgi:aspartate 1-decarboxylase
MRMILTMLKSKIHRAVITEANLNYVGSITIDRDIMDQAKIFEYEQVHVVNINNGSRFETYAIGGPRGSGTICINGAAARLAHAGDKVIIMAYCSIDSQSAGKHKPIVVFVNDNNEVAEIKC